MINTETLEKFKKLYDEGASLLDVKSELGITLNDAFEYMKMCTNTRYDDCEPISISTPEPVPEIFKYSKDSLSESQDKSEFIRLLISQHYDAQEISEITETPIEEVNEWLSTNRITIHQKLVLERKISDLYFKGRNNFQIADQLKIPTHKVHKWCRDNKLEPRKVVKIHYNPLNDPESLLGSENLDEIINGD